MKRIMLITMLAVVLLSAAGTIPAMAGGPAKAALSCESPAMPPPVVGQAFQITGILTYGTSDTPVSHRSVTVYASADGKKWTEIGSATTDDSGRYTVTTSQDAARTYRYRAVFDGDRLFKKVTSPTISVQVNPMAGATQWPWVSCFELYNEGGFVARLACYYSMDDGATWKESGHTDAAHIGVTASACLYTLGVPDGALVKIHAIVVGGKDRTGSTVFRYHYDNYTLHGGPTYSYSISGTTLNPTLRGPYGPL